MPTYNVVVKPNTLTDEQKMRVAQAITDGHHEATGAAKFFVQVIIDENPGRKRFVGGYPCETPMWICGYIRSGLNDEQRAELMLNLVDRVAKATGLDSNAIWCYLVNMFPVEETPGTAETSISMTPLPAGAGSTMRLWYQ